MSRSLIVILITLTLFATNTIAAQLIENTSGKGGKSTFVSNGKKGRMNSGDNQSYGIVDYATGSIHFVMPEQREVLDMSGGIPDMSSGKKAKKVKKIKMTATPAGSGPRIAGYSTKKFKLSADGEKCGTVFGSKKALKDAADIVKMFEIMEKMAKGARKNLGAYNKFLSNCERAETNMIANIKKTGAPLRSLDKHGKLDSEVTLINKNAKLDPDTFIIPSNYKVVTVADKMKDAQAAGRKSMQQMQQQMPDMQKMMEQMQKNGRMPPEALEQMKRAQEMMRQYQQ